MKVPKNPTSIFSKENYNERTNRRERSGVDWKWKMGKLKSGF